MVKRSSSTVKPSMSRSNHPYKGVRIRRWGSWVSEIRVPHQKTRIWLGSYSTPEAAARAYDAALLCLKGSSAGLNFPDSLSHHQNPAIVASTKFMQRAAAAAANNAVSPTNPSGSRSLSPPPSPLLSEVTESDSYVATSPSCVTASTVEVEQWLLESPRFMDLLLGQSGLYTPLEDQCEEEGEVMSLWGFC